METRVSYKQFVIVAQPRRTAEDQWTTHLMIERHDGPSVHVCPYAASNLWGTEDEAIAYCVKFGLQIIDGASELSPP